ncbi:MAG: hypothetical protein ACOY5B_17175 [Spirochaetota bacterium]
MPSGTKNQRLIAILQVVLALGFTGFWLLYFFEDACRTQGPQLAACLASGNTGSCLGPALSCERYLAFENSFPLPDLGYIVPLLVASAWGLWLNRRWGYLAGIMAGSALIFLGLLDISFNLQNARYSIGLIDAAMNVLINAVCVIFGPLLIRFCWQRLSA